MARQCNNDTCGMSDTLKSSKCTLLITPLAVVQDFNLIFRAAAVAFDTGWWRMDWKSILSQRCLCYKTVSLLITDSLWDILCWLYYRANLFCLWCELYHILIISAVFRLHIALLFCYADWNGVDNVFQTSSCNTSWMTIVYCEYAFRNRCNVQPQYVKINQSNESMHAIIARARCSRPQGCKRSSY